jgi:hypothetical protein
MGQKILRLPQTLSDMREQFEIFDHFVSFTDAQLWTVAVAGTGTAAHEGSAGRSAIKLFNTAANDAAVLATTHEIFKFRANKAMMAEARIIFTDVDTDDGHVAFGWADALAATTLADSTGAVTATDAALIYKVADTSVWAFHTEINGASVATVSGTTAGGTDYQTLRIEIVPRSATVLEARPYVDGVQLKTATGVPIKHDITLGTATDLDFGAMTKSNDAADFNVYVDYLYAAELNLG